MPQPKILLDSIMVIYPVLSNQSIKLTLRFNKDNQEWTIELKRENHHLKTEISTVEAENIISGKPCESLGLQIDLISMPIN